MTLTGSSKFYLRLNAHDGCGGVAVSTRNSYFQYFGVGGAEGGLSVVI